ncbi:hypothetical protein GQ607_002710 [Colletotrichum asianum]|uniref:Uncharacterized protein n=1 Tax=Colletotrichum asianum TaxID=702518 RepID=A0A8H3WSN2_9PEZI|nr:hypothetical protein GQ607_002710 [Colletotrichum asianum]
MPTLIPHNPPIMTGAASTLKKVGTSFWSS